MLSTPPSNFKELTSLVQTYNALDSEAYVQKIYYLQKINFLLNKTEFNLPLLQWVNNATGEDSWKAHLRHYGINPDASIFLKGFQFAIAVSRVEVPEAGVPNRMDQYDLMQARDSHLETRDEPNYHDYVSVSQGLAYLAHTDPKIMTTIARQVDILDKAKQKIAAIQGVVKEETEKKELIQFISSNDFEFIAKQSEVDALQSDPMAIDNDEEVASKPIGAAINYETKPLGDQEGNNKNFIFQIHDEESEQKARYVFCVEDRSQLAIEQKLHSYPVSQYFIEVISVFRMAFLEDKRTDFRPVVLSQFATQGNLEEIAASLRKRNASQSDIAAVTKRYFSQLSDCCLKLMDAGYYHPDIKLSNFLVHRNQVLISDRKTIIDNRNPNANKISSTPLYAPNEYIDCFDPIRGGLNMLRAKKTPINMPEFMSFELGMALKEFLLLTQYEEIDGNILRDHSLQAVDIFKPLNPQIANLWLLAQELTRPESNKRLPIATFHPLLLSYVKSNEKFYEELEQYSPSVKLGQEVIDKLQNIQRLLSVELKDESKDEFKNEANEIFKSLADSRTTEPRLLIPAQTLACKYYEDYAKKYFSDLADSINQQLLIEDLKQAPWYRILFHYISFGFFRVDEITDIKSISIATQLQSEQFLSEVYPHLNYLPLVTLNHLGVKVSKHIKDSLEALFNEEGASSSDEKDSSSDDDSVVDKAENQVGIAKKTSGVMNKKESLSKETFVVEEEYEKPKQDDFAGTFIAKGESEEESMSNGTFIVAGESEKSAQTNFSGTFIAKDESEEESMPNGTFIVAGESEKSEQVDFTGTFIAKVETEEELMSNGTFIVSEDSKKSEQVDFAGTFIARDRDAQQEDSTKPASKKKGKKRHNIPEPSNESEKEPLLSADPNRFFSENKRLGRVLSIHRVGSTLFRGDFLREERKETESSKAFSK